MSYFSASNEMSSEVCGMVDSPTAKRGCTSPSSKSTLTPRFARMAAMIEPDMPLPRMATSKLCVDSWRIMSVRSMLDQCCSPREPGAVGRQHDQVSFFDVAFIDGVDV